VTLEEIPVLGDEYQLEAYLKFKGAQIYQCPPDVCLGNNTCAEGHTGPVCGICVTGYALSSGKCTPCGSTQDTKEVTITFLITGGTILLVAYYVICWRVFFQNPDMEGEPSFSERLAGRMGLTSIRNLLRRAREWMENAQERKQEELEARKRGESGRIRVMGCVKIGIGFFQVLSSFLKTFPVQWPKSTSSSMQYASVLSFDLMAFPGPNCASSGLDYAGKLTIYAVFPLAVMLFTVIPSTLVKISGKYRYGGVKLHPNYYNVVNNTWRNLLFWFFVIYPTVSVATLSSFNCQKLGLTDEDYLLVADYRVKCPLLDKTGSLMYNTYQ
jgi:hypothetical protein